ncbi:MAG: Bax inhibitor-1 family protein [Planctomycetes bacterium]|nr:Bax inhibitor-1 family protein [Planctomycetota bacterium]
MSYDSQADQSIHAGQIAVVHAEPRIIGAFLKKVYSLFFFGIILFAGVAALSTSFFINKPELISRFWWGTIVAWMLLSFLVGRMLVDPKKGVLALVLFAIGQGVIFGPLLAIAYFVSGGWTIVGQAVILTVLVFGGLTGYVLITKEDFSFLGGFLSIVGFFLLGIVVVSLLFGGLALGSIWAIVIPAVFILFFSLYVLYDTSVIMRKLPPEYAGAGAAMLFLDFAGMLYYVLMLLISLTGRD